MADAKALKAIRSRLVKAIDKGTSTAGKGNIGRPPKTRRRKRGGKSGTAEKGKEKEGALLTEEGAVAAALAMEELSFLLQKLAGKRYFRLESTIKMGNMHAYNAEGEIKRYNSPLEVRRT